MPFDGAGNFTRLYDWTDDAAAAVDITASRFDDEMDGMVTGMELAVLRDGQNSPTADLPMATQKHTNVGNAAARNQYAAAGQVQDNALQYGGTSGGTANAQTLSPTPAITSYATGSKWLFKVGAGLTNTGATTMQISGIASPKNIYSFDGVALVGGELVDGRWYEITYDGTQFRLTGIPRRGTFTPVLTPAGGSLTHSTQIGVYRIVDDLVFIHILLGISATSSPTGALTVTGLPVASANTANHHYTFEAGHAPGTTQFILSTLSGFKMSVSLAENSTTLLLKSIADADGAIGDLATSLKNGAAAFCITGFYRRASA